MANEVLVNSGASPTTIVWADTTDFNAAASGFTRTHQIDLTSLGDTNARQGAKADFGALRAPGYAVRVGIEVAVAPVAGEVIEFYLSASHSGTAATGNDGGCTGADAAYKNGEEAEWAKQLILIGVLVLTADATTVVQYGTINGYFSLPERYGSLVVKNEAGQALVADAVEMFVAFIEVVEEVQ